MINNIEKMERIFSGIQPTGNLHLGNYLGAIKNWVDLQNRFESIYCVVDLHAITIPQNPKILSNSILEVTACLIASGINPNNSILFNQSAVSEHTELAWIFNCVARLGWLNRMTQFKEKAGKDRENATVGLFSYPTLMASDILTYKATLVPVGEDQKQHLELTRDIANAFNSMFSVNFFDLPEPEILKTASRVMSLRDGNSKMSKSDESDFSRINLIDDQDEIIKKIKKAKTDPYPLPLEISELENRVEAKNLINIYAGLSNTSPHNILREYGGKGFGVFKENLSELLIEKIVPIGKEMKKLMENKDELYKVLRKGSLRAKSIAKPILKDVRDIIGLEFKI